MSRKGENIFKRKDGRWEARYEKGRHPDGSIIYGFCYGKTYREAREKVNCIGKEGASKSLQRSFGVYCDEWLDEKAYSVKHSTYVKYKGILDNHIMPRLGHYNLSAINATISNDFIKKMCDSGLSPKTVRDIRTVYCAVLDYMQKNATGLSMNFDVVAPKLENKEVRVLSSDEEFILCNYLLNEFDDCKFGILLAVMTGLRIGELCAMKWESISLSNRTLCVNKTMQRLQKQSEDQEKKTTIYLSTPKSAKSLRVIPLTSACISLCKMIGQKNPNAYLLTGTADYMEPRVLQYRMAKYTKACGLDGVHFHTLRHTFATRAIEAGFEIKSLSEILGHSSTSVTLNRYVHSSFKLKRDNMEKIPTFIG